MRVCLVCACPTFAATFPASARVCVCLRVCTSKGYIPKALCLCVCACKSLPALTQRKSSSTRASKSENHSKNSVCCRRRLSHTAFLTVILALTLKSGVALRAHVTEYESRRKRQRQTPHWSTHPIMHMANVCACMGVPAFVYLLVRVCVCMQMCVYV